MVSLDALERAEKGEGVNRIERTEGIAAALRLSDLSVTLDTGKAVVKDAEGDLEVAHLSNQGQAIELGTKIDALIGLGLEGEEGVEAGAEAGASRRRASVRHSRRLIMCSPSSRRLTGVARAQPRSTTSEPRRPAWQRLRWGVWTTTRSRL